MDSERKNQRDRYSIVGIVGVKRDGVNFHYIEMVWVSKIT